jgi:probable addiction module antidote protein
MPKRTRDFQSWFYGSLADPRAAASYLNAAKKDSLEMFLIALRDVAEAHRMSKVAKRARIRRESLYRMLSKTGNPTSKSLDSVLKSLGFELRVIPVTSVTTSSRNGSTGRRRLTTLTKKLRSVSRSR